jgi:hypothetical protein
MKLAVGEDFSIGWTDLDNRNASALGETTFPLDGVGHDTLRLRGIYATATATAILGMTIQ